MSREVESWAREQKTGDPARKAVLMALANYADPFGRNCYPSIPRVAEEVEVSVRTVQRHLTALEEVGLIKREQRLREDGSLSTNLFVFPTYVVPKLSHRLAPNQRRGGGDILTPGGDNLTGAGDAAGTGVVTMVSPPEDSTLTFPPTADEESPAVPPQGGLLPDPEAEDEGQSRSRRGSRLDEDWSPPPIEELPDALITVVRQWPAGAYEFAAVGFKAHWAGESGPRASKLDWNSAWSKWLTGESSRIMAMARNGITFAALQRETTHAAQYADVERLQLSEDRRVGMMRAKLKDDLGARTYDGWLKPTSMGFAKIGAGWALNVVCPSAFMCDWIQTHLGGTILAAARKTVQVDDVRLTFEPVDDR